MNANPILYWPYKRDKDADYQTARRLINASVGVMPRVLTDAPDIAAIVAENSENVLYYPVFCESTGWWGELLGTEAIVADKIIISSECQLMAIRKKGDETTGKNRLFAAEIFPTSGFLRKMSSDVATVADMLATDSGTILALFSGKNQDRFVNILESTGNSYLGCIGRY